MLLDQMLLDNPKKGNEGLLPLFHEKIATPEMIQHWMELVQTKTEHLNPHQVPVLVVDPNHSMISQKNKFLQWAFPDIREDKLVVIL